VRAKDEGATWRHAGHATLDVLTAPWESLTVTLTHGPMKIKTLKTVAGLGGKVIANAIVSCPTFGDFVWTVVVSDGPGDRLTRRVSFSTSACGPKPPAPSNAYGFTAAKGKAAIAAWAAEVGANAGAAPPPIVTDCAFSNGAHPDENCEVQWNFDDAAADFCDESVIAGPDSNGTIEIEPVADSGSCSSGDLAPALRSAR
jgi:hypothetical protein